MSKLLGTKYKCEVSVKKVKDPTSRPERFGQALSDVTSAKDEAESLKDELQQWLDNLPENLQGGEKAHQLEDTIQELDNFISSCEDLESTNVDFPGMF